ncbi:hypothetical protein [Calycomorphotria hydatis]|uniref:hypothetical protein n=1 Tax=Calycomorphotria hydatis TaxID=2528027 RepID=UPI00119E53D3|nr:hypothetical protein [Calycomorphotria hydatis]
MSEKSEFEQRIEKTIQGLRKRQTPPQVRAALIKEGVSPARADEIYEVARNRLSKQSRQQGAKLAEYAVYLLCGACLLCVPFGLTIPFTFALIGGLMLMGVGTLVWLTGVTAHDV